MDPPCQPRPLRRPWAGSSGPQRCPLTKSLLQPLWAWKMAVRTMGHPPKVVRMLAALLKELFTHPFEQYSPFLPKSPWWGCSDASASKTGDAYVGGKDKVLWFH